MNPTVKKIGDAIVLMGWAIGRVLTFRPRQALDVLVFESYLMPVIFVIGGMMTGLRWMEDGHSFLRLFVSFISYTALVAFIGPRCRKFVLAYCLMSAALDALGLLVAFDAPDGSPVRVSLSAYELIATVTLIVAAARLPRVRNVPA